MSLSLFFLNGFVLFLMNFYLKLAEPRSREKCGQICSTQKSRIFIWWRFGFFVFTHWLWKRPPKTEFFASWIKVRINERSGVSDQRHEFWLAESLSQNINFCLSKVLEPLNLYITYVVSADIYSMYSTETADTFTVNLSIWKFKLHKIIFCLNTFILRHQLSKGFHIAKWI